MQTYSAYLQIGLKRYFLPMKKLNIHGKSWRSRKFLLKSGEEGQENSEHVAMTCPRWHDLVAPWHPWPQTFAHGLGKCLRKSCLNKANSMQSTWWSYWNLLIPYVVIVVSILPNKSKVQNNLLIRHVYFSCILPGCTRWMQDHQYKQATADTPFVRIHKEPSWQSSHTYRSYY